jgi:UDP-N-acetylmuramoyl-tripeptide--D-alanyl-D-alanine ligase
MTVYELSDGVLVLDRLEVYPGPGLPALVGAALRELAVLYRERGGSGWAVLGEMEGLGETTGEEHDAIGRLAVRLGVPHVVSVGDPAGPVGRLHAGATLEGSWDGEAVHVPDSEIAVTLVRAGLGPGDVVVVAGTAGALGAVLDGLTELPE